MIVTRPHSSTSQDGHQQLSNSANTTSAFSASTSQHDDSNTVYFNRAPIDSQLRPDHLGDLGTLPMPSAPPPNWEMFLEQKIAERIEEMKKSGAFREQWQEQYPQAEVVYADYVEQVAQAYVVENQDTIEPEIAKQYQAYVAQEEKKQSQLARWANERTEHRRKAFVQHDEWQQQLFTSNFGLDQVYSNNSTINISASELPISLAKQNFDRCLSSYKQKQAFEKSSIEQDFNAIFGKANFDIGQAQLAYYQQDLERIHPELDKKDAGKRASIAGENNSATYGYNELDYLIALGRDMFGAESGSSLTVSSGASASNTVSFMTDRKQNRFYLLPPGPRKKLSKSNMLSAIGQEFSMQTEEYHIPGLITVVRINPGEVGFAHNNDTRQLELLLPGTYVLRSQQDPTESRFRSFYFVGRIHELNTDEAKLTVEYNNTNCPREILQLYQTNIAFIRLPRRSEKLLIQDKNGFYTCSFTSTDAVAVAQGEHNQSPILLALDQRNNSLNFSGVITNDNTLFTLGDQVSNSYQRLMLRPNEFIIVEYNNSEFIGCNQKFILFYDPEFPELNELHFSSQNNFNLIDVLDVTEMTNPEKLENLNKKYPELNLVYSQKGMFTLIQDHENNIRILQEATQFPISLLAPWKFIAMVNSSVPLFEIGDKALGNYFALVTPLPNQWSVIMDIKHGIKIVPSPLNNTAMVFSQRINKVYYGYLDRDLDNDAVDVDGKQVLSQRVPTGTLALVQKQGVMGLLEPALEPYVFLPPDKFEGLLSDMTEQQQTGYVTRGDLHIVFAGADEIAVVKHKGEIKLLGNPEHATFNDVQSASGVYIFRAQSRNFEFLGKTKLNVRQIEIGPVTYVNPSQNTVAFGLSHGECAIWERPVVIDNTKGEYLRGFFDLTIDPHTFNVDIIFEHGITGAASVNVQFTINDISKLLGAKKFNDHDAVHEHICALASTEVRDMCITRPPFGYTHNDVNQIQQSTSSDTTGLSAPSADTEVFKPASITEELRERLNNKVSDLGMVIDIVSLQDTKVDPKFKETQDAIIKEIQEARGRRILAEQELRQNEVRLKQQELDNKQFELELETKKMQAYSEQLPVVAAAKASEEAETVKLKEQLEREKMKQDIAAKTQQQEEDNRAELASKKIANDIQLSEQQKKLFAAELEVKKLQIELSKLDTEQAGIQAERDCVGEMVALSKKSEVEAKAKASMQKATYPEGMDENQVKLHQAAIQKDLVQKLAEHLPQSGGDATAYMQMYAMLMQMHQQSVNNGAVVLPMNTTGVGIGAIPSMFAQMTAANKASVAQVKQEQQQKFSGNGNS